MRLFMLLLLALNLGACAASGSRGTADFGEDTGSGGGWGRNSTEARITHLISEGRFAEAEALIAESKAAGLLEGSAATTLRKSIAELSMKLGEIPASLQHGASFPARLRDFTRFELQRMLDTKNFSIASKKELQTALKLLKEQTRLMQKAQKN